VRERAPFVTERRLPTTVSKRESDTRSLSAVCRERERGSQQYVRERERARERERGEQEFHSKGERSSNRATPSEKANEYRNGSHKEERKSGNKDR